jgi:hypothetical protein
LQAFGSFTYADGSAGAFVEVGLDTAYGTAPDASAPEGASEPSSETSAQTPIDDTNSQTHAAAPGATLVGSDGADTFVFKAIADSLPGAGSFNTITDFTHNSDHIDLTAIAGANNVQGSVAEAGLIDAHSISWFVDDANSQTIVYVNTTADAGHVDMEIRLTGSNISLSGSDILHHT